MIDIFRGVVLGLVQGLTEFFPVSSSGHLILVPSLLGWPDQGIAFDTVLHLGTLFALLWAFRSDLQLLYRGMFVERDRASRQFGLRLLIASFPGLLVGALFGDLIEAHLRGPNLVAFDLAFWALILLAADRFMAKKADALKNAQRASWRQALSIGISQAIAFFPGTSRSGITMTAGLLSGMDRTAAVTFSFYLSIPTIAAAGSYGILKIIREPSLLGASGFPPLVAGFFAALVSGVWAIRFLRSYVSTHSFNAFIWYRLALAAIVLFVVR